MPGSRGTPARKSAPNFRSKIRTRHCPNERIEWSRKLAQREGIFTGISGGATFAVAMQVAQSAPAGSVMLAMLPDTGERYLSTPLFDGIVEGMDEDEIAIMKSTPNCQMPS